MKKYCISLFIVFNIITVKAQTTCTQLRDRSDFILKAVSIYEAIASPTQKQFDELNAVYTNFRDFAIKAAATETDYDIKILLQIFALQSANHFLSAAGKQNNYELAWKEMKLIYDEVYNKINYQKMQRRDNFVICFLSAESKQISIIESTYHELCTDFIALSCKIALHYNNYQLAATLFAGAGFRGFLKSSPLLHTIAGNILNHRLDNNQLDDTTYLAACKVLLTNNERQSFLTITSDFSNQTIAHALEVVTNPALVARSNMDPLKKADGFERITFRYDNLYTSLAADTGFKFPGKFDILKIALTDYLANIKTIRKTHEFFWYVPSLHELLDRGYDEGGGYLVRKEMQDILNSGDNELISMMAQVYELYADHCIGSYPVIEKAHHYYSAYLCYRAMGDSKMAKKAFNDIPNAMLANDKKGFGGYRKLD